MAGSRIPLGPHVRLLTTHPSGLLALEKPAGIRSHPNTSRPDAKALLPVFYDADKQCYVDGEQRWFLLHRLDSPTSGVILLADNESLATELKRLFATRQVQKTYAAIVHGKPRRLHESWQDRLRSERRGSAVRTARGGGIAAVSSMKAVHTPAGPPLRTLLELQPKTGRTHQLRIQCASRKLPIIGDATYGDFRFNREFARNFGINRLFLHAERLEVNFSYEGAQVRWRVESPLPEEFRRVLRDR